MGFNVLIARPHIKTWCWGLQWGLSRLGHFVCCHIWEAIREKQPLCCGRRVLCLCVWEFSRCNYIHGWVLGVGATETNRIFCETYMQNTRHAERQWFTEFATLDNNFTTRNCSHDIVAATFMGGGIAFVVSCQFTGHDTWVWQLLGTKHCKNHRIRPAQEAIGTNFSVPEMGDRSMTVLVPINIVAIWSLPRFDSC